MTKQIPQEDHDAAMARMKERYPDLHFARNGAMHIGALPCLVCDQETVDEYRRQHE